MSATKVGIIYSLALSKRRWMVVPDSDAELPLQPRAGEGYVEQSMSDYQTVGPDAAVQQATGKAPLSDRCCVAQASVVASVIHADPACDAVEGSVLVLDSFANVGDTYSAAVGFLRTYAQINSLGVVTAIITAPPNHPPVAANIGGFVVASTTLQVGNSVPPPVARSTTVTPSQGSTP